MNRSHELKILPEYYNEVYKGVKTSEIRKDDRGFKVGDTLIMKEYFPNSDSFSGRFIEKKNHIYYRLCTARKLCSNVNCLIRSTTKSCSNQ